NFARLYRGSQPRRPARVVTDGRERCPQGHEGRPLRYHGREPLVSRLLPSFWVVDQRGHAAANDAPVAAGRVAETKPGPRPPDDRRIRPGNARQRCNCLALRLSGAGTLFRGASVCAVGGVLGGALTMRPTRSTTAADCAGPRLFSSQPQPNLHSSQPASASGGNAPPSQFKGSQQWLKDGASCF